MALITLEYLEKALGITNNTKEDQYSVLIDAASREIKNYLQLDIEEGTYTEYHTGNLTPRLALRQIPVTSITGVWLKADGYFGERSPGFASENELVSGTDYVLDVSPGGSVSKSGILYRIGTVWPLLHRTSFQNRLTIDAGPSWGNIKVSYTAGYNPIPDDIKLACVMLAQRMKELVAKGGWQVNQERLGDYSYQTGPVHLNPSLPDVGGVLTLLAPYKQMGW